MRQLILMYGDIGTGKTTLAKNLAAQLSAVPICFDDVMLEVMGDKPAYDGEKQLMTTSDIASIYQVMLVRAREQLTANNTVILESMYFAAQREHVYALCESLQIPVAIIHVVCDQLIIKDRLRERKATKPQTAGVRLYEEYRGKLGDEPKEHFTLDTTDCPSDECVRRAKDYIVGRSGAEL